MTKKWKIILICFIILPCVVFFGGCSCNNKEASSPYDKLTYNVTFYTGSEDTFNVPIQTVKYGSLVRRPVQPVREDYTFGGWFKDMNCTIAWMFDSDTIHDNTTLFAKWNPINNEDNTFTVQFFTNTSEAIIETQIVEAGGLVEEPIAPTKINFVFGGWYRNQELTIRWNFQTNVVDKNTIIYAKWIPLDT